MGLHSWEGGGGGCFGFYWLLSSTLNCSYDNLKKEFHRPNLQIFFKRFCDLARICGQKLEIAGCASTTHHVSDRGGNLFFSSQKRCLPLEIIQQLSMSTAQPRGIAAPWTKGGKVIFNLGFLWFCQPAKPSHLTRVGPMTHRVQIVLHYLPTGSLGGRERGGV